MEKDSQEAEDIPAAAEKEMGEQNLPMEAGNEEKEVMGQGLVVEVVAEVEGKENESGTGKIKDREKIKVVTEEREIVEACHAVAE